MNRLKQITTKAKALYKTGKYKKWTDAIKQASKSLGSHSDTKSHNVNVKVVSGIKKKPKKVGAIKILQKGESKNARVTKTLMQTRGKKGHFKGYKSVSGISGISKAQELKRLIQLATKSKSPLTKKVALIIKSKCTRGGYDNLQQCFEDISRGLSSGIINELIYYSDTLRWYKKYKKEIMSLLKETMYEMGAKSPVDVFGRNWDDDDVFAQDTQNQNLLAWYSFEDTSRNLANELGYDI